MDGKKIKIWLSLLMFSLMVASGAASFLAKKNTFYKGLEPLEKNAKIENQPYASILNINMPPKTAAAVTTAAAEAQNAKENAPIKNPEKSAIANLKKEIESPCANGTIPIIKNSKVAGCRSQKQISPPSALGNAPFYGQ